MSLSPDAAVPMTRQKANTNTTKRTQKELEEAEGQSTDVRSKEQAIEFLTAKQYLIPGKQVDLQTLAYVLLQLGSATVRAPKQVKDRIRAVAFLLANASAQQITDKITTMVKDQLQDHIEVFTSNIENMRDAIEHVTAATDKITGKIDEFSDGFQETTEQLAQATQELAEKQRNQQTRQSQKQPPTAPSHINHSRMRRRANGYSKRIMQRS
jgi:methyl-accepting chemotaxis protein